MHWLFLPRKTKEHFNKVYIAKVEQECQEKHNYIVTSFNSRDKAPHIQRYDTLCQTFREIAQVACENQETSELLFAHL